MIKPALLRMLGARNSQCGRLTAESEFSLHTWRCSGLSDRHNYWRTYRSWHSGVVLLGQGPQVLNGVIVMGENNALVKFEKRCPNCPIYMFSHSMGMLAARNISNDMI